MTNTLKNLCKGVVAAAAVAIITLVSAGFFMALMLLVIAMEEGGENLTEYALPFAQTSLLLAQGIGFDEGSFRLTITPLLLTCLIIGSIRAISLRVGTHWCVYIGGLAAWLAFTLIMTGGVTVAIVDPTWLVMVKAAAVFTIGFLLSVIHHTPTWLDTLYERFQTVVPPAPKRALRVAFMSTAMLLVTYLLIGFVTVVIWIITNYGTMATIFDMAGMQMGSRILTTIACLAWLPNLCIWAISWVFGAGFHIGEVATFSLWISQSDGLPAVPAFGLLPTAVDNDPIRILLMMLPVVCGLVVGLLALLLPKGFNIRIPKPDESVDHRLQILVFVYPALALCLTAAVIAALSALLFGCASGSLGQHRLSDVGVDVMQSTRTVGQGTALGLGLAWLLVLVGMYAVFGIRWARERYAAHRSIRQVSSSDDADEQKPAVAPRVVNSTPKLKEEQGDNNEPTD